MLIQTASLGEKNKYPDINLEKCFQEDCNKSSFPDGAVWFDIETTGLSPKTSVLYMIGAVKLVNNEYILTQWISEKYSDEAVMLSSFNDYLYDCTTLIHFNGSTFDIPYIIQKCAAYGLHARISEPVSIDIYKIIKPYRELLGLASLKQKSLEVFCGLNRHDYFSGADLIPVYTQYVARLTYEKLHGCPDIPANIRPDSSTGLPVIPAMASDDLLKILLLHNSEDLSGMLYINALLRIIAVFSGNFTLLSAKRIDNCIIFVIEPCETAINNIIIDYSFEHLHLRKLENSCIELRIDIVIAELKYFYTNFKDYYYLPKEDMAIHRSVADFVDKKYRTPAKASTCYTKRYGNFIPSYGLTSLPLLREAYKDKLSYIELTDDFLKDTELINEYICAALRSIKGKKKNR